MEKLYSLYIKSPGDDFNYPWEIYVNSNNGRIAEAQCHYFHDDANYLGSKIKYFELTFGEGNFITISGPPENFYLALGQMLSVLGVPHDQVREVYFAGE